MSEPTKADLKAAVTRLTEENAALYDIFAAARAAADAGTNCSWIVGYIGGVGQPGDRGNAGILRSLAAGVRRGPRGARPAPGEGGVLFPAACDPDGATEPLPLACGCSVPLGHLGLFRPGHPVECVQHGPTTVAGPATPEERLLLAVHGVSPDNPANVRELRTHEAECTLTDHTPCLAHLTGQTASVTA